MVNIIILSPSYFGALISRKINFPVETLRTPDVPQEKSQQITERPLGFQGFIWQEDDQTRYVHTL